MKASEWIDRVKRERGWDSDYRVAKELGLSKATVSKYRTRTTTLDEVVAVKVADALGEEPDIIIIDQAAERTRSESARAVFNRALDKISRGGGGAAVLVAAIAIGVALPSRVEAAAASFDITNVALVQDIHRIWRRVRRWLAQLAGELSTIGAPALA